MMKQLFLIGLCVSLWVGWYWRPAFSQIENAEVLVLDRSGNAIEELVDGARVSLRLTLAGKSEQALKAHFSLDGTDIIVAECQISVGEQSCTSEPFHALGWFWGNNALPVETHIINAEINDQVIGHSGPLQLSPRPVVMVHGFISNYEAWKDYLGPQGFLAAIGVQGFAVGDGQVPGELNTGSLTNPAGRTNTLFENAAILGEYILAVKRQTGAEMVDLVGHSMGGMISRVYIDRVMGEGEERDVAQLIMLGTPSLGSDCASLPVALGWYLPAALEIRPSYAQQILNPQISHRKGVPFFALAGVPIQQAVGSPCTDVPSDSVVSLESVHAISLELTQISLLHTDLNASQQAFEQFVKPLIQKSPDQFAVVSDPTADTGEINPPLQFSRIFTGHLNPGETRDLTIQIESGVRVASFALYDPSRSLETDVIGASGNQIQLDPQKNGLLVVDDPQTLVHLGYGFNDPKPGAWHIVLKTSARTPSQGADYAMIAKFSGGLSLDAMVDKVLPQVGEAVEVRANLSMNGIPQPIQSGEVQIQFPDGKIEIIPLELDPDGAGLTWKPEIPGIYGLDLRTTAVTQEGVQIDRTAFLVVEAQPQSGLSAKVQQLFLPLLAISIVGLIGLGLMAFGLLTWLFRRRRS